MFLVVCLTGGCYCKVVAVGRKAQLYLWYYSRHVVVIVTLLLKACKYSCVSDSMIDRGL